MTTSRSQSFLANVAKAEVIPEIGFVYFRGHLQNDVHALILEAFLRSGLTQKELAHRIGKQPSIVNRWIGATGNWELNSIAEFLAGMNARLKLSLDYFDGKMLVPDVTRPIQQPQSPQTVHSDDASLLLKSQKDRFEHPFPAPA
jgi:hypothetical protein